MGKKIKRQRPPGRVVPKKSPYKNRRVVESFMAAAMIDPKKKKHVDYAILMEGHQILTSREVYQINFDYSDFGDASWVKAAWPKELPVLLHRSKLKAILGEKRSKVFWSNGSTRK